TKLAEQLRQPAQAWLASLLRTILALLEGRFADAEQLLAETRSLGERVQSWGATVYHGLGLYLLRREQGRVGEVEGLVRRLAADERTYAIWRCVVANMLAELGVSTEARAELNALAADSFLAVPFDEDWIVSLCLLAEPATRLGERDSAATLYELLLPYADRVAYAYPELCVGPVARYLGLLASAHDRQDEAAECFERAIEMSERIGSRPWLARAQDEFGQLLFRRGHPGDTERARELLDRARAKHAELGMSQTSRGAVAALDSTNPLTMPG